MRLNFAILYVYSGANVTDAAIRIWLVLWSFVAVERWWMLPQKWRLMARLSELSVLQDMKITRHSQTGRFYSKSPHCWRTKMDVLTAVDLVYQKTSEYKWSDLGLKRSITHYSSYFGLMTDFPCRFIRAAAYRWTVRWLCGYMGWENTRPLPACIYQDLRTRYPTPHTQSRGYKNS